MTPHEAASLIRRVSCPDPVRRYRIAFRPDPFVPGVHALVVEMKVVNVETGKPDNVTVSDQIHEARLEGLDECLLLARIRELLHRLACHEIDEWLRVGDRVAFQPHGEAPPRQT